VFFIQTQPIANCGPFGTPAWGPLRSGRQPLGGRRRCDHSRL